MELSEISFEDDMSNDSSLLENKSLSEINEIHSIDVSEITSKPITKKTKAKKGKQEEVSEFEELDGELLANDFEEFLANKVKIVNDYSDIETIPTGIRILDVILGGGVAIGTYCMIVGFPGCGKSMLASQILGNAQKVYDGKMLSGYLDSEQSQTTTRLASLGVNTPKVKPFADITIEKVFKYISGLAMYKKAREILIPSIVIWDSVANTLSEREVEAEDVNGTIGIRGRLMTLLIPKHLKYMKESKITVIAVNQLRDDIQIGPTPNAKELNFLRKGKTIPGGNSMRFNMFHLIDMKVKSKLKPEKYGFDGIECEVFCIKNKLFQPDIKIKLIGNFSTGFSDFWSCYDFMSEHGALTTGSWNYLSDYPEDKFRTIAAEEKYNNDIQFKERFDAAFNKCIEETFGVKL